MTAAIACPEALVSSRSTCSTRKRPLSIDPAIHGFDLASFLLGGSTTTPAEPTSRHKALDKNPTFVHDTFVLHQPTPTAAAPTPPTGSLDDPAQIRALCKNFLREGVELSNRLVEDSRSSPHPNPDAVSRAYARIARAMHRTILLLDRLDHPPRKSPKRKPTPEPAEHPEPADSPDRPEPQDRQRGPEIGNQPTPDVIAAIQRDLDQVRQSHPDPTPPVGRKSEAPSANAAPPPEPPPETETATPATPASTAEGRGEGGSQNPEPPHPAKKPPDG